MPRKRELSLLDIAIAGVLTLFALVLVARATALLIITPPISWAFVAAFGVAVALTASLRIELGRRSGMPIAGLTVTLLVIMAPEADPFRLLGVWTAASLVTQLLQTRNPAVAGYVTGLGSLAALLYVSVFQAARVALTPPIALLAASVLFLAVILLVDLVRQRGRWGMQWEVGFGALAPKRVAAYLALVWLLSTAVWFLDAVVVPAMAGDPAIEQSPMVVLVVGALVFGVAKRIEVRRVRRRLAGVLDAALGLPWGNVAQAERKIVVHARTSIEADAIEVRDEPAAGREIDSAIVLPDGRTRYVVASKRVSAVPFDAEDEQILDALAHMGADTLATRYDVESLRRSVDHDALTGLPNQRVFQTALAAANRDRSPFEGIAVLFLDLDDFKDLNDGRGHHVGDKMLRLVGERLAEVADEGGVAARVGGDEFALVLRGLDSAEDARRRAQALVERVSEPATVDGDTLAPVVTVGVAFSAHEEQDPTTIVIEADRSMLALKRGRGRSGRGRSSTLDVTSVLTDPLREVASRALRDRTLDLAFQPVVDLATERIWAYEALVRLEDPVLGRIDPSLLIRTVRHAGLLDELTVQVVEKAMSAAACFRDSGAGVECMSVNADLEQLAADRLGPHFAAVPARFPGVRFCIELSEGSLAGATDELRAQAQTLRDAGVLLALDDFGTEGSSALAVATFPLDIVKLDRALIAELTTELRQREIVRAMQSFAVAVGVRMIVEGAEDEETIAALRALGVTDVQGFVYGRPDTRTGAEQRLLTTGSAAGHCLD